MYIFLDIVQSKEVNFDINTHDTDQLNSIHLSPVLHHISLYNKNLFKLD